MRGLSGSLGDVAEFINGVAFKPEDWGDEGARIIRIQNLTDPTKPCNRTNRVVSERVHVQPGDLLVSWSATLGVFEWDGPDVAYLNQHIFRVVPDERKVDKRYLRHALELALLDMRKHLHGATMLHVNRGEFLSTKLFLPSLSEQRRIAAILEKADDLRTKRREALVQLDRLTQSVFVETFGEPTLNNRGWETCLLGEVVEKITDGEHINPDFSEDGMPIIMAGNVLEKLIDITNAKRVDTHTGHKFRRKCNPEKGDLLVVSRGATIGRMCLVNIADTFCLMGSVILIKLKKDKLHPAFVTNLLKHPAMRSALYKTSGSSAQQAIYLKDLKNLSCIQPHWNFSINSQKWFLRLMNCDYHTANRYIGWMLYLPHCNIAPSEENCNERLNKFKISAPEHS